MPFDPCGTRKLEGEDIIIRLAIYLGVSEDNLRRGLLNIALKEFNKKIDGL